MKSRSTPLLLLTFSLRLIVAGSCMISAAMRSMAQDPPYRAFSSADGLASNTVYCALKDAEGYMWFGTDAGVSRFDGTRFENFTSADGLADDDVLSLYQDSKGRIWFLSLNGILSYYFNGRFHGVKEHPEFGRMQMSSGCSSIAEDVSGGIWFTSLSGDLYHWKDGRFSVEFPQDPARPSGERLQLQVMASPSKRAYAIMGGALFGLKDGHAEFIYNWRYEAKGYPRAHFDGERLFAMGSEGFLELTEQAAHMILRYDDLPTAIDIAATFTVADNEIWVGLSTGGILRARARADGSADLREFFPFLTALRTYKDDEGIMWFMTDGNGVLMVTSDQIGMRVVRVGDEYRKRSVSALVVPDSGEVLFGTMNGSIHRYSRSDGPELLLPARSQAVRDRVRDMEMDSEGTLWFATDSWIGALAGKDHSRTRGPYLAIDDRARSTIPVHEATAKSLAIGPNDEVVASMFSIARLIDTLGTQMFFFQQKYRPGRDRIYAPYVDRDERIWFETNDHLYRWADERRTDFPALTGAFGPRITDIDELPDGTMVIATSGSGAVLLRDDTVFKVLNKSDGLPSDRLNVAVVRGDQVLIATAAGACIVDHSLGDVVVRTWSIHNGLPTNEIYDIDTDGRHVYLATSSGLCVVPRDRPDRRRHAPRITVRLESPSDTNATITAEWTVSLGTNVMIHLRAPEFEAPSMMEYVMRKDADTVWSVAQSELSLIGLDAGEHQFEFKARILGSPWSPVERIRLTVDPPWHSTAWFKALGFAMFIALGGLVAWGLSRRRFMRREAELRLTMATQSERQRIAAGVHDDLGADISHLLLLTRESAASPSLAQVDQANLRSIETNVSGVMQKIDEIIWSLDPRDDEWGNALGFIQAYAEAFADSHNMVFRTQALPDLGGSRIPTSDRREVYLIVKEILNNIGKHTHANELRFVVSLANRSAVIEIEDNGEPVAAAMLSANKLRRGHGLANMEERIARLSGSLRSEPLDPLGTKVTIRFPLRATADVMAEPLSSHLPHNA